jgi:hypothetical protein
MVGKIRTTYQLDLMISLPKDLILKERGFLCRDTLGFEERFFFFWSSRPIVEVLSGELVGW